MTPSVAAASPAVALAAPFAAVSKAAHDREWWAEKAVHAGTDWYGVVTAALEMLVTTGILELPESESLTHWRAPSWREAAIEYHCNRRGCLAVETEPKRLARLRALMVDGVSLKRAWHELCDFRTGICR